MQEFALTIHVREVSYYVSHVTFSLVFVDRESRSFYLLLVAWPLAISPVVQLAFPSFSCILSSFFVRGSEPWLYLVSKSIGPYYFCLSVMRLYSGAG